MDASRTTVKIAGAEILIVEDSRTQAEQLRYLLEAQGYQVAAAANGKEALEMVRQRKPSLVITDVLMPEMDGFNLCKEIKSRQESKEIPVVLMTSLSSPQDVMRGLACGADNFIRKPYEKGYLLKRIEYILTTQEFRKGEMTRFGLEIYFGGEKHYISSERQQILDMLISTYEDAVSLNQQLQSERQKLARSNQIVHALYRIAESLNRCASQKEILEAALEEAQELPGVQAGWISLWEGETGFRMVAARGLPPALEASEAWEGDCQCRRMLLAGEFNRVTNIVECERLRKAPENSQGMCCHASVPLWMGDRTVGVMNLAGPDLEAFDEKDLAMLYSVGNQLAVALERAELLERLESRVEERTAALQAEIADRQRADEALRESEERYRLMFECHPHPMWVYDTETLAFLAVNDTAVTHYGYAREEFLGMKISDIRPAEDIALLLDDVEKANETVQESRIWRHRKKDGSVIHVEVSSHSLPFGKGTTRLVWAHDITERKKLEEQLHQASKMEAIGQLAGGVAHDFNNLLTIINGYSDLLLESLDADDTVHEPIVQIRQAGERAASLTRQLLAFGRRQVILPQVLDLNTVLANMEKMVRRLIGEDIDLVMRCDEALGWTRADPGQIEQIIVNLAVNARDAMPQGGKLTLETANVELGSEYVRLRATVAPGPYVMLAVSDTGIGMDAETQARIFEPFFTTKEKGKGTGLGLAMVYGIVKQSGGNIWVYSEPGRGSTFKIYLPRMGGPGESAETRPAYETVTGGSETILLVEDEEAVRKLAATVLQKHGYKVLESTSVEDAMLIAARFGQPIDLLLTDVVMPRMNGRELADRIAIPHPEIRTLYMSGYTDSAIVHQGALESGMAFLQKPFTPEMLARKVREALKTP